MWMTFFFYFIYVLELLLASFLWLGVTAKAPAVLSEVSLDGFLAKGTGLGWQME